MNQNNHQKRHPWLAVLLSVAATGLGHIYSGHLTKGLVLFFVSFAFAPLIVATANHTTSTTVSVMILLAVLLIISVYIYAVVDSYRTAKKTADFSCKAYNQWPVYLLFILVSLTYPTSLSATIRENVWQAFKIPSTSMSPGILRGDRIFLNKAIYNIKPIRRGDVVVFIYPDDRRKYFLKRVVALPGDTVGIQDNVVRVNNQPLQQAGMSHPPAVNFDLEANVRIVQETNGDVAYPIIANTDRSENMAEIKVPHGQCFVLGDNRPESKDSRHFGTVPLADVKGRLDYIYWSALGWDRFGRYVY